MLNAYATLANLAVTVDSYTYPCHNLDQLKETYDEADCKRRILLPWEARGNDGSLGFVTLDKTASVNWRIVDLMLYGSVQTYTLKKVAPHLVSYAGEYAEQIRSLRTLAKTTTNHISLKNIDIQIGVFDYPLGGNHYYLGVKAILSLVETMTNC